MFKKFFYNHNWVITSISLLLLIIGIVTIYSTSVDSSQNEFQRQVLFAIAGVFIYFIISIFDYSYLKYKPIVTILYIVDALLLLLEFIAGHSVRGATRWLNVGLLNLQPSEITKIVLILALSSYLSQTAETGYRVFLKSFAIFAPLALLVFIEPSLSATVVLLIIWTIIYFIYSKSQLVTLLIVSVLVLSFNIAGQYFMPHLLFPMVKTISMGVVLLSVAAVIGVYLSKKISLRVLCITLVIGILLGFSTRYIVWNKVLKPYQKERITAFTMQGLTLQQTASLDDQTKAGIYQVQQSKIAIGSGELFGKGFAQGTQSKLNFLPDHNTDFIFASFSEEFGLLGDTILLILFSILIFWMIGVAERVTDRFGFYIITGIITVFIFQTFVNIAINMGMLPATGVPMPLVSYGGSSLWVTLILLGLVQSIYKKVNKKKWLSIDM